MGQIKYGTDKVPLPLVGKSRRWLGEVPNEITCYTYKSTFI